MRSDFSIHEKPPRRKVNVKYLVQLSLLVAVLIIFDVTGIGYLRFGVATPEITIMLLPVITGAIMLGSAAGAILGAVFGLTSFIQCFGRSVFGGFLLGINPFATFIMCIIPRIIVGLLTGLIFKSLHKIKKTKSLSYTIASIFAALSNTFLFVTMLVYFFGSDPIFAQQTGFDQVSLFAFFVGFIGPNGVLEVVISLVYGFIVGRICIAVEHKADNRAAQAVAAVAHEKEVLERENRALENEKAVLLQKNRRLDEAAKQLSGENAALKARTPSPAFDIEKNDAHEV
jgi:uncharacterized membrane protein